MLLIALTWVVIFVLVMLLGAGTYALYIKILGKRYKTRPTLFQFAWLGYASLIALLQIYSIFFAVNIQAVALVSLLALTCCIFSYRYLLQCFERSSNMPFHSKTILVAGFVIIISYLSFASSSPLVRDDTILYHLNAVKWASNYPAIPGIVNLHGRLAFNSSFQLFAALTNTGPLEDRAVHIANGFLLLLISLQWFAYIVTIPRNGARLQHAFLCITSPYLLILSSKFVFPSLANDRPFHMLSMVAIFELLSIKSRSDLNTIHWHDLMNRKNLFSWLIIVTLATVGFSTKLSGIPQVAFFFTVSLALLIAFTRKAGFGSVSPRHLAVIYGLPLILVAGFVIRFIILSGWLVYPLPFGNLHLDWSVSSEQVINQLNWTKSYARMPYPGERPEVVLGRGISYWFPTWFATFSHTYPMFLLCLGIVGVLNVAFVQLRKKNRIAVTLPLYLSMCAGILGLIFCFLSAPDIRFGEGYLWVFVAASISPLFLRYLKCHAHMYVIVMLTMATFACILKEDIPSFSSRSLQNLSLVKIPSVDVKSDGYLIPVTINNGQMPPLVIFKPAVDDCCENSPLPCSPYVEENSTIELRVPGDVRSGFKTTGSIWADMQK